jgi:hypothetical protein
MCLVGPCKTVGLRRTLVCRGSSAFMVVVVGPLATQVDCLADSNASKPPRASKHKACKPQISPGRPMHNSWSAQMQLSPPPINKPSFPSWHRTFHDAAARQAQAAVALNCGASCWSLLHT